jgi:hypothetical protein
MVLVYYPNTDHDIVGLSKYTQKYLTILLEVLPRNNQSKILVDEKMIGAK